MKVVRTDLSYVHKRINLRSYLSTDDNRAKDAIQFANSSNFKLETSKPLDSTLYHIRFMTKKVLFNSKF